VELLVVVVVVAIIAGFIVATLGLLGDQSRSLQTIQRIEQAVNRIGQQGGDVHSTAYALQANVAGFGGTATFETAPGASHGQPSGGAAWHEVWPDPDGVDPLILAYPWGRDRLYWIREGWYADNVDPPLPVTDPSTWSDAERSDWEAPEKHDLSELFPRRTAEILAFAGIAESVQDYRDQRDPDLPFNDAWGNPLVVAYCLFQPGRYGTPTVPTWTTGEFYQAGEWVQIDIAGETRRFICIADHDDPTDPSDAGNQPGTSGGNAYWSEALRNEDYYLDEANRRYDYNRSVFVAVGAAGRYLDKNRFALGKIEPGSDAAAWNVHLDNLWDQVCETVMPDAATTWDEESFEDPPWTGVAKAEREIARQDMLGFLGAPSEFR